MLFDNQQLELFPHARPTLLNAGYMLNQLRTGLAGIWLTCPQGQDLAWAIEIQGRGGETGICADITPAPSPTVRVVARTPMEESHDGHGGQS